MFFLPPCSTSGVQGAGRRLENLLQDCLLHESLAEAARRRHEPESVCEHGLVWQCEQVVGLVESNDSSTVRYF